MAQWIYFLHPPRDNFAATMTDEEGRAFSRHFEHLQQLLEQGTLILAGPTLGEINTGIAVFEAPDEHAAQQIVAADPVVEGGYLRAELRPFRVSLLRKD
ncbi:YciI family protein [Jatrophihabitans sp. DSM 45814]